MKVFLFMGLLLLFSTIGNSLHAQSNSTNEILIDMKPLFQSSSSRIMYKYNMNPAKLRVGFDFNYSKDQRTENDSIDLEMNSMGFAVTFGYENSVSFSKSSFGYGADIYYGTWKDKQEYYSYYTNNVEEREWAYSRYGLQPLLNLNVNVTEHIYFSAEAKGFVGLNKQNFEQKEISDEYTEDGMEIDVLDQMMFYIGFKF